MSYCRFSSDDFQCDVYCYHDVGGWWQTYVAARRHVFAEPLPPEPEGGEEWVERYLRVQEMLNDAELVPIGLPHDGASFRDATPGEAAGTLVMLRDAGYNVPQYAIDGLRQDEAARESA